jgi:hypothetical protein
MANTYGDNIEQGLRNLLDRVDPTLSTAILDVLNRNPGLLATLNDYASVTNGTARLTDIVFHNSPTDADYSAAYANNIVNARWNDGVATSIVSYQSTIHIGLGRVSPEPSTFNYAWDTALNPATKPISGGGQVLAARLPGRLRLPDRDVRL